MVMTVNGRSKRCSWLVVTFDENAGGTVNPIPTIIVGDHVRPGPSPERIEPLHPAPHHRGRVRAAPLGRATDASPLSRIWMS